MKKAVAKQAEDTVYRKPLPVASLLHKPDNLPQYQVNLSENVEMELLLMEKQAIVEKLKAAKSEPKPPEPPQERPSAAPIVVIQEGNPPLDSSKSFVPVDETARPSSSFSPRPRSLTPSMISKRAPTIPYNQANLVAQQHLAPEVNVLDPRTPNVSRSPSPCPERRSTTPFRGTPVERARSPA